MEREGTKPKTMGRTAHVISQSSNRPQLLKLDQKKILNRQTLPFYIGKEKI